MHKKYKSTITFNKINEQDYDSFSKVKIMQNHTQNNKPELGLSTILRILNSEPNISRERLKELVDPVKQVEEPVVEKIDSLKECLEAHKEPESKKYERRSLREDLGLTEKSEQKE